ITNFFTDTADKLSKTISEVAEGGAEGILIDVRDNPGGLLSSVVDVTSLFIDDGLVLYEVDGEGRRTNWEVRRKDGIAREIPVVILANEFSASASEILVGALQDHDRATFVGAQTFGKGSVNILRGLGNGGGLFLTFAHWFTPSGRLIQGNGLAPDIEIVSRDAREADTMQLEKAREVLLAEVNALAAGRSGL
ncbi:MAG: S41 family peptidase, partial [Chloroflexi bacterium]|nr:S41 family peptidase [Chloroflexota bacterium]